MNTMLAAVAVPGPEGAVIELREMPVPQPGAGEVLIRVRAAGLNRGEQVGLAAFRTGSPRIMARSRSYILMRTPIFMMILRATLCRTPRPLRESWRQDWPHAWCRLESAP